MSVESTPIVVMGSDRSLKVTVDPRVEYVTVGFQGTVQWVEMTEFPPDTKVQRD